MSQAEDLLNTLTTSADVTRLADASTEPHIIIDENRVVIVPDVLKRLAVQYDHNVETVTFDCPRYWDEHDMSEMVIYINYLRSDKETGTYRATDVTVDSENPALMHFNWTISRNVTEVYGQIVFLVCIKKADADGNERNHWNSELCKTCTVSEGLEVNGEELRELYPDIIDQWYNEVLGVIDEVNTVKQGLIDMRDSGEFDGATFTPSVSSTGDLSWTNDRGRENPETVNVRGPGGVSPKITVTNIQGGHRITITDVNGTQHIDVKDTIIDPTEAAKELIDDLFIVSTVEPETGPVLWFETVEDAHWSETIEQPAPIWAQIQATIGNLKDLDTTAKNNLVAAVNEVMAKGGEALDNRIKKFYTGNLGTVNIADSDDGAVRNLVIGGNSEQYSTTGAQLFDMSLINDKENLGIVLEKTGDGGCRVSGTSTAFFVSNYLRLALAPGSYYLRDLYATPTARMVVRVTRNGVASYYAGGKIEIQDLDITESYIQVNEGVTVDIVLYPMLNTGETALPWEPYTGGAPSPSPDYPQEIKSVENCAMTVSNADGTETQTAMIPFTLRGIGDVRDELYVYADGSGKLVQRFTCEKPIKTNIEPDRESDIAISVMLVGALSQKSIQNAIHSNRFIQGNTLTPYKIACYQQVVYVSFPKDKYPTYDDAANYVRNLDFYVMYKHNPIETPLTAEQVKALFNLRTYYGGTNVSFDSDNGVDPVVNFDYACALENFVEYIKAAQGDDRKFIYDMDERMTDAEYVAALAYVNSEYATALTELEV